jgi:hypothetical protein
MTVRLARRRTPMSMFDNDLYRWRETYFVLFDAARRPALRTLEKRVATLNAHYLLTNCRADRHGRFESLSVVSPDDFAALDVSFLGGKEVREAAALLAKELRSDAVRKEDPAKLKRLAECDGRFDILHFEMVTDAETADEADEMFDPSTLLLVLDALVGLTNGIAVDPQSGTILEQG